MKKHRAIHQRLASVAAASVLAIVASTAMSGEITGNGKSLQIAPHTLNGKSICAFSGRQDNTATAAAEGNKGLIAQSWGQLVKEVRDFFTSIGANPGNACSPGKSSGEPG